MLFECLTGAVPYEGAYPRVLMAACNAEPPPSVRLVRPQVEAALESVIARALAKKRADRFATVGDLAAALRKACPQSDGLTRMLVDAVPAAPRRKFNRAPYRTPVRVTSAWGELDGRCEDISEGGMLMLSEEACKQGEEVTVRFGLPIEGKITVCKARDPVGGARDLSGSTPPRPSASSSSMRPSEVSRVALTLRRPDDG